MRISPLDFFGDLNLLKLKFMAEVGPNSTLPINLGSTLRGVLGWQLQGLTCPFDRQQCNECSICRHCPYYILFAQKSDMSGLADSPRGYIISPHPYNNDGIIKFSFTLLGDCCRIAPAVVKAFIRGEKNGIGHRRNAYKIINLTASQPGGEPVPLRISKNGCEDFMPPYLLRQWISAADIDSANTDYTARLVNPVRLRKKGKYLSKMDWPFFFSSLVRRLEGLNCLFNNGDQLGRRNWKELMSEFKKTDITHVKLQWRDLRRYSNRQGRKVPLGGLTGQVEIKKPSPCYLQWWQAASLVHIGKGAVMGLGKIHLSRTIH